MNFIELIGSSWKAFIGGIAIVSSLVTGNYQMPIQQVPTESFGSFNPVQAQRFTLYGSGIGLTDTSIKLTSFKTPDGNNITTSSLGSIFYATLEPGTSKEEQISATGVTQNGDGTALITGVTRGLAFTYPYAASSTLRKTHAGGTAFVLSNTAAFYSQFAIKQNTESITGVWTFASSSLPKADSTSTSIFTDDAQFVTKAMLDATAFGTSTLWLQNSTNIYNGNAGNVGIGTTTPADKLTVIGSSSVSGNHSVGGNLSVTGTTSLTNTLNASGTINASNSVNLNSTTTLAGTNNLTGSTTLSGSTTVSGPSFNINSTTTANSPVTFATTTTFSSQVVGITPIIGTSTFSVVTSATTTDTTITTGFLPGIIKIYFFNQGHDKATESNVYKAESGFAVIASSTKPIIVCYNGSGNTGGDNQSPSAIAARGCQGNGTAGGVFSSAGTNDPGVGTGNIYSTLSIPSITNTGFTIRRTTTIGASNSNNARAEISYEVYR